MPTTSHVVVSGLGTAPSSATSIPRFRIAVAALLLLGVGLVSAFVVLGRPRSYSFMDSNAGMSLTFQFRAEMTHVELELDDGRRVTAPFGIAARGRDGDTAATEVATFMLADSDIAAERTHLTVRYRFLGIPRSMAIDFSASDERQRAARAILEGMPNAWIGVTSSAPHRIYFTNLLSYKCALREIRWGTGEGPMDRRANFTPSESLREGVDTKHDDLYANLPTDVDRVRIELVYKDGTTSGPRTIRLSDAAR